MRLRRNLSPPPVGRGIKFDLMLGPTVPRNGVEEFSVEELEAGWTAYGPEMMSDWPRNKPGFRPWAFWECEIGEHPEDRAAEILLLAERGLLFDEELEVLAERQTWTDINDGTEHVNEAAVELHERVVEALEGPEAAA